MEQLEHGGLDDITHGVTIYADIPNVELTIDEAVVYIEDEDDKRPIDADFRRVLAKIKRWARVEVDGKMRAVAVEDLVDVSAHFDSKQVHEWLYGEYERGNDGNMQVIKLERDEE